MTKKNISYNLYTVRKDYTVSAYLTIKAVSEEHAKDIAENFDYSTGWESVSFSGNDDHVTDFDLEVEWEDTESPEILEHHEDDTATDSDGLCDDVEDLFDSYGEDDDFDWEEVEEEEEAEEEVEREEEEEVETEEGKVEEVVEEEPTMFTEEPPKEEVQQRVQLNFLAKSDNITWDLTVQGLIDRLKELPPNATITMPMYCTEFAIGDVVAYVK